MSQMTHTIRNSQNKRLVKAGFTLTELMVTVGVMGAMSATAFVNIANRMPAMRDERAVAVLISGIRECRLAAVTSNMPVEWWVSGSDLMLWADEDGDGVEDESEVRTLDIDDRGYYSTYPSRGKFDSRGEVIQMQGSPYPGVWVFCHLETRYDWLIVSGKGDVRTYQTGMFN